MSVSFFYAAVYKPFQVLCQFSAEPGRLCLKDFFSVPRDVYPVGRLDADSEGLLLLTNDGALNSRLLHPSRRHAREYWVQVEGMVSGEALGRLQNGITIASEGKKIVTLPCTASLLYEPLQLPPRNPPIRFRQSIPTSWIRMILTEGKNRQVRKMTAAVGLPTLRLVRYRIEEYTLEGMQPGDMRIMTRGECYRRFLPSQP
jgi:23S rRNA pseudouridine2457 synthase